MKSKSRIKQRRTNERAGRSLPKLPTNENSKSDSLLSDLDVLEKKTRSNRKKTFILAAVIVLLVSVILGGAAYNIYNSKKAVDASAVATYESFAAQVEAAKIDLDKAEVGLGIATTTLGGAPQFTREDVLKSFVELKSLEAAVVAARDNFVMADGSLYRYEDFVVKIDDELSKIANWIEVGYIKSLNYYDLENVILGLDGLKELNRAIDGLNKLKNTISSEAAFEINQHVNAVATLVTETYVESQISKLAERKVVEKAAIAARAKAKAASKGSSRRTYSNSGGSSSPKIYSRPGPSLYAPPPAGLGMNYYIE